MYGTVAKIRLKPGNEEKMLDMLASYEDIDVEGYVGDVVFRSDKDPNVYYLNVVFESREDYVANAESPEQHERFLEMRELLDGDPEWNDGEIVYSQMR